MKNVVVGLITAAFLVNTATAAGVAMRCQGDISKSLDSAPLETQPAAVTLNIDSSTGIVEIKGWWGCLANMGQSAEIQNTGNDNCTGKLQMVVRDSEFTYYAKSDGPLYSGDAFLTLNRINGAIKIMSSARSKPAAGARWKFSMYQSDMQCSIAKKLF